MRRNESPTSPDKLLRPQLRNFSSFFFFCTDRSRTTILAYTQKRQKSFLPGASNDGFSFFLMIERIDLSDYWSLSRYCIYMTHFPLAINYSQSSVGGQKCRKFSRVGGIIEVENCFPAIRWIAVEWIGITVADGSYRFYIENTDSPPFGET